MTTFYIVTPSYNQAAFIKFTIDGVLKQQGNFPISYVVMDGGSTDDTVKILKSYGSKIEWVSEKDGGQTAAINKGIEYFSSHARRAEDTRIFAYLNSDDYYLPDALAEVAKAFALNSDKKWLVGDAVIIDQDGTEIQKPIRLYKKLWRMVYGAWVLKILNPLPQPAVFIRWDALEEVGAFSEHLRYVMDYEYWLRLQAKFGNPILLPIPLAAFRIHGQSKGGTAFVQQFAEELQVVRLFCKNSFLLSLHWLHNQLILSVYRLIK